jgi:hypothetical protein
MFFCGAYAQDEVVDKKAVVDSLYREDQFYFNVSFNNIQNSPSGLKQNKISSSIAFGFLRDMPINKSRTFSIAAGLGYTKNILNENLYTYDTSSSNNSILVYEIISSDIYYSKNKLITHSIDIPIEYRWRTSVPNTHKFWRIYTGLKLSYLFYTQSKYEDSQTSNLVTGNPDINKFQYGTYLSVGYNTVNFNIYYGLNPIFKSAELNGKAIDMNSLNFGFMFYIL